MPKREVTSDSIRKPVGVFSQATVVEAEGRILSPKAFTVSGEVTLLAAT